MIRKYNWQSLLVGYIESCRNAEFIWGELDCGLFAAGAVEIMTGIDTVKVLRGKYKTSRGAAGILKHYAGGRVAEAVDKALAGKGFVFIELNYAQRGDVVIYPTDDNHAAGICMGMDAVFLDTAGGLTYVHMSQCTKAWRI